MPRVHSQGSGMTSGAWQHKFKRKGTNMAKRLTVTNTRDSYQTLWYFQTNPPKNTALDEWLENNSDKVTFHYDILNDAYTQVLQYTFADDVIAEEFATFAASGDLGGAMDDYHASVGITSTRVITDL